MFTTLSTILVPINTGFTSSFPLEYPRLFVSPDFTLLLPLPFETCPLEGEQELLFGIGLELHSVAGNLTVFRPGLTLDTEAGLSGKDFFICGGASVANLGISGGFFDGLDLTEGELPRDNAGFFTLGARAFVTEEDLPPFRDVVSKPDGFDDR